MATLSRFEELGAWQQARALVARIYELSKEGGLARDFALRDQMRAAAISVASNVAEGFERSGRAEFVQFLSIAKGSAGELRAQLYLALDQHYLTEAEFIETKAMTERCAELVSGLMRYLKRVPHRGNKFKPPAERAPRQP